MKLLTLILAAIPCFGQLSGGMMFPGPGSPAVTGNCSPGYVHCRQLTLTASQMGGSTLTNFPWVTQNGSTAMTLGSSRIQNANCYDVVFTTTQTGTTLIPWKIKYCNQSTGAVIAYVLCASCSSSVNTTLWVQYDNASITTAQNTGAAAPANVWDSNYVFSYGLGNGTTLDLTDATANANNLTDVSTTGTVSAGSGQIDGAAVFVGANGQAIRDFGLTFPANNDITVSYWSNAPGTSSYANDAYQWISGNVQIYMSYHGDNTVYWDYAGGGGRLTASIASYIGAWHYYVFTAKGNNTQQQIIVDGTVIATQSTGSAPTSGLQAIYLGSSGSDAYDGRLSDVRTSTIVRAAGWITAEWNNQKASSTFLTVGSEI